MAKHHQFASFQKENINRLEILPSFLQLEDGPSTPLGDQ
jgi:hypothetical protein